MSRKGKEAKLRPEVTGKGDKEERRDEEVIDTALKQQKADSKNQSLRNHFGIKDPQDPDWYDNIPELVDAAGRVSFGYPVGSKVNMGALTGDFTVPGIMGIRWIPSYGISKDTNSALNVAANVLFIKLRSVNSGFGRNYMPADLAMRIIAADNLYIVYQDMMRAYGVITQYAWSNQYLARTLVYAMGFDYDDLRNNGPRIQYELRVLAEKLNAFPLPTHFDIIKRHQFLASNYFLDGDSNKAQFYVPEIDRVWIYSNTEDTGTQLNLTKYHSGNQMTFQGWVDFVNNMYNAVAVDDDFAIMGGDIMKAFGNDEVYKVLIPTADYITVPVYNELFLQQISNMVCVGSWEQISGKISQVVNVNNSYITSQILANIVDVIPGGTGEQAAELLREYKYFLNTYINDPTPMDVVELTRFMPTWTVSTAGKSVSFTSTGAEVVTDIVIYTAPANSPETIQFANVASTLVVNLAEDTNDTFVGMCAMTQFHGYPMIRLYTWDGTTLAFAGFLKNIENYAIISGDQVKALNEGMLLSLIHAEVK